MFAMIHNALLLISGAVLALPIFYGLGGPVWISKSIATLIKLLPKERPEVAPAVAAEDISRAPAELA
ncbi:MAG TPA: hypothetical protein VKY92_13055 [Verrucomicrobiae bacterium]|nr:hypothetical protein [Verrucomicrobiae bacterium]